MAINDKTSADHTSSTLAIWTMVRNRLPFVADTVGNQTLVSNFILEIMHQLELCFQIGADDPADIGIEANYTVLQQSIIADVVAIQMLIVAGAEAAGGNADEATEAVNTFLKKAKAGSVEVEFGPFEINKHASFAMSGIQLMAYLKRNAINKAAQIDCIIDICDDCSLKFLNDNVIIPPFNVVEYVDNSINNGSAETLPIID